VSTLDHWAAGQQDLSALGRTLTDADAATVVPACPVWSVRDVFAHQAGVAADILGGRLEGVTTDPWTDRQVRERADRSLTEILDEWDADAPRLLEAMAPLGDAVDPRMVIDVWTHDQDVRGALGRPGGRIGARADWVADRFRDNLATQVERAGLAPLTVDLGDAPVSATGGTLTVDRFEFSRGSVGRRSLDQIRDWAWAVADPEPYVSLIPVFDARANFLLEPEAISEARAARPGGGAARGADR
jgi:uncharacterized protein (TIGR03083 family)